MLGLHFRTIATLRLCLFSFGRLQDGMINTSPYALSVLSSIRKQICHEISSSVKIYRLLSVDAEIHLMDIDAILVVYFDNMKPGVDERR